MSQSPVSARRHREHPEPDVLARFILGRLDAPTMAKVERHVDRCEACCRALLTAPGDRLTLLLRQPSRA